MAKIIAFNTLALMMIATIAIHSSLVNGYTASSTYVNWGAHHCKLQGDDLQLVLDKSAGNAQSKRSYLFGSFEMLIKPVPRNSQQFYPWFDPTADFHNYTIHWTLIRRVILFMFFLFLFFRWFIDGIPIRVFRNYQFKGIPFPNQQGMRVYTSLWNADEWATRGGLVKIDWTNAPFIASYRSFRPKACDWNGPLSIVQCAIPTPHNCWASPSYYKLSANKVGEMNSMRSKYMIYDYCKDWKRFKGVMPIECSLPQY
ncbi:unnamed protein product [Withania somnifera]